jgi:sulfoxide reductase heme-binding subunit YedZ
MVRIDPANYIWWLVSRAAGIVALGLISVSVLIGLTMATKILRRPGLTRKLARLHEHVALVALAAIVVHGASLLGDRWLRAGVKGLIVPFTMGYRPLYTGLGMVAAYLAALLGLSFYVRRLIGTRLWRKLHRATVLVWVLGVVHTIGSGTDASTVWLRMMMLAFGAPIVFLLLVRILHRGQPAATRAPAPAAPATAHPELRRHVAAPGSPAAAVVAPPGHDRHDEHARRARRRPAIAEETT